LAKVKIQVKDISGHWFTIQTVMPNDQVVQAAINSVQKTYKKDVRAIGPEGLTQMYPYIKGVT
jgi:hypothetical protein